MAGLAAKIADRFRPGIFDRLKQSAEAKKQAREKRLNIVPTVAVDIETRPNRILESQTTNVDTRGFFTQQQVWREWTTANTITACTTYDDPWNVWHQDCGTGGTSTIWNTWSTNQVIIRTTNAITTSNVAWETWVDQEPRHGRGPRRVESAADRRLREDNEARYRLEREAENARYHEQQRAAENKRKEADDRALKLLVSMLNDQQRADLKRDKHFFVDAPSGRLYRIDYGTHGNVKVVDRMTRKVIERLCIQPNGVPAGDANLMQKLLIETAEEQFRAHANITLEDGRIVYGIRDPLTSDKLAKVIPLRKAA